MNKAEDVMNNFMKKLNNGEFVKDTCVQTEKEFNPTDKNIKEKLDSYGKTLQEMNKII